MTGDWRDDAACREEPEAWFPRSSAPSAWKPARDGCRGCPSLAPCLEWALSDPDPTSGEGMWGALDPDQRRLARRRRTAHKRRTQRKASA